MIKFCNWRLQLVTTESDLKTEHPDETHTDIVRTCNRTERIKPSTVPCLPCYLATNVLLCRFYYSWIDLEFFNTQHVTLPIQNFNFLTRVVILLNYCFVVFVTITAWITQLCTCVITNSIRTSHCDINKDIPRYSNTISLFRKAWDTFRSTQMELDWRASLNFFPPCMLRRSILER